MLIKINRNSKISQPADVVGKVSAATKQRLPEEPTTQPMGNQFDQSVHILLDSIVISMTQSRENINEYMKKQHVNLD